MSERKTNATGRKKMEAIDEEACIKWLRTAYLETITQGFCVPAKWENQAGKDILANKARKLGYIELIKGRGKSAWVNLDEIPSDSQATALLAAYIEERERNNGHDAEQARKLRKQAKQGQAVEGTVEFTKDMFDPADLAHFQRHLDVLTNEVAKTNLLLERFMEDCGCDMGVKTHYSPNVDEEVPF